MYELYYSFFGPMAESAHYLLTGVVFVFVGEDEDDSCKEILRLDKHSRKFCNELKPSDFKECTADRWPKVVMST